MDDIRQDYVHLDGFHTREHEESGAYDVGRSILYPEMTYVVTGGNMSESHIERPTISDA
jgi:hypothetical protein